MLALALEPQTSRCLNGWSKWMLLLGHHAQIWLLGERQGRTVVLSLSVPLLILVEPALVQRDEQHETGRSVG